MKRGFLLLALIYSISGAYGQLAAKSTKSQRVIITVDYCYNLLLKNPLNGFFSKNSLPYAMTYIAAHRADKSQNVTVVNLGDSMARVYRFANPFIGVVDTIIKAVGYDKITDLPDNIREFLNSQDVKDSVKALRAAPIIERGSRILVAQLTNKTFNLRSVDITQYYLDKQTVKVCETVAEKLEHFFKDTIFRATGVRDPIDMLYEKSGYADLFHQFQIARTAADISLFAASNLSKIDSILTFADIYSLLPYDNQLVVISMTGKQVETYIEKNYAGKWLTMHTDNDDLLRLTRDSEGRYRTMKALHNIDNIQGVRMTVNLRRPTEHRVKIQEVRGRKFSYLENYSVVTTSFRAAQLLTEKFITDDVVKVISTDYTLDFMTYIRNTKIIPHKNTITVDPQSWLEKAYLREIPFIRRTEVWTM